MTYPVFEELCIEDTHMLNGKRLPQYFLFDGTHVSMCCRFFAGKRPD
jgi:hypothetical protein